MLKFTQGDGSSLYLPLNANVLSIRGYEGKTLISVKMGDGDRLFGTGSYIAFHTVQESPDEVAEAFGHMPS